MGGGSNTDVMVRRVMSRAACRAARSLTPVHDAMSGFFALRSDRAKGARTVARGFKICLELLVRTTPGKVVELPYGFVGRAAGKSKMNIREVLGFLRQLWDLRGFNAAAPGGWPAHEVAGPAGDKASPNRREARQQGQRA